MLTSLSITVSLLSMLVAAAPAPPVCTDGGTLYCCQATFSGGLPAVVAASNATCYDLTPEVVNCIITEAPVDPTFGCLGTYSCCQVNNLAPVVGLFCSKPPGDCVGGRDQCTNILKDLPGCENA